MLSYSYILFDLDGTLTNPYQGITRCVQYALERLGLPVPPQEELTPFIGPSLMDAFQTYQKLSPQQAAQGVEFYRERYREVGWLENECFPGILPLLRRLKSAGARIGIASLKPQVFVEKIARHFEMWEFLDVVCGSELSQTDSRKEGIIQKALSQMGTPPLDRCVLIGDRAQDALGAQAAGIAFGGVRFGFAAPGELEAFPSAFLAGSVEELSALLLVPAQE